MKYNSKELEKVIKFFYMRADKELVKFLKAQQELKTELYNQIGEIMVTYTISNDVMAMSPKEQAKEIARLSQWIKTYTESEAQGQIDLITNLLRATAKETMSFYGYNANKSEIDNIIKKQFKGKHFSSRVWENEEEVAKHLKKKVTEFAKGTISVNNVKKDIQKVFNSSDYNAKRLAYTEIARTQADAFTRFANEVGVTRVTYNAKLDGATCNDCKNYDLKKFPIAKAPKLPRHPLCRCYYEVADDIENLKVESPKESPKEKPKETVAVNKDGKEIPFLIDNVSEKKQKIIRDTITELCNEYNTRLVEVSTYADNYKKKGLKGSVDVEHKMNITSAKKATIVHEFAHSMASNRIESLGLEDDGDLWKEIASIRREYAKAVRKGAREISDYANTNIDEFFAEAFTHSYLKDTGELDWGYGNDFTYSDKVRAVIDKYLKK